MSYFYSADKELTRWKHGGKYQIYRFDDIRWTSYQTIDRIRTKCTAKKFSLSDDQLCQCCELQYVDSYRNILGLADRKKLRTLFGQYFEHAVLYWYWYGRSKWYFLAHVWKCYPLYERGNPLENIFKVSVSKNWHLCRSPLSILFVILIRKFRTFFRCFANTM